MGQRRAGCRAPDDPFQTQPSSDVRPPDSGPVRGGRPFHDFCPPGDHRGRWERRGGLHFRPFGAGGGSGPSSGGLFSPGEEHLPPEPDSDWGEKSRPSAGGPKPVEGSENGRPGCPCRRISVCGRGEKAGIFPEASGRGGPGERADEGNFKQLRLPRSGGNDDQVLHTRPEAGAGAVSGERKRGRTSFKVSGGCLILHAVFPLFRPPGGCVRPFGKGVYAGGRTFPDPVPALCPLERAGRGLVVPSPETDGGAGPVAGGPSFR